MVEASILSLVACPPCHPGVQARISTRIVQGKLSLLLHGGNVQKKYQKYQLLKPSIFSLKDFEDSATVSAAMACPGDISGLPSLENR